MPGHVSAVWLHYLLLLWQLTRTYRVMLLVYYTRFHIKCICHCQGQLLLRRGMDPFGAGPSAPIQQAFPEAEAAAEPQARAKTTRRTFPPRHLDGDEDYNSADGEGKNGRKRRYRVAEVRGSWSPEEAANLMQ